MKKLLLIVLLLFGVGLVSSAYALTLAQAKASGLVREQASGYLAPTPKAGAEARALVANINARRRASYARIAKKNKVSVQVVASIAGKKAVGR
ncbi:MAG: DUF1318 domain-containing protein [Gammaproteobacteria bacterium]